VPTPWGTIALRIPPGTSSGKKLRAAGMGVHHGDGAKGDLIAEVQIILPASGEAEVHEPLVAAVKAAEAAAPENVRSRLQW
jgi:DnaJ-class molecular chaperone